MDELCVLVTQLLGDVIIDAVCVISKSKAREIIATQDKDIQHSNSFTDFRQFFTNPIKFDG